MALNNNAININAGFEIGSGQPIDSRQLLTKVQMLSIDENIMPSKYFCICSDDGLLYTYDANNEVDEELGKFRVASGLEVIRLTQAEYNQMVEDGEIEDKFYLITDAPNPSTGGASNALELAYDNTTSELNAVNVQDAIDELNIKSENKLDKVESMPATPSNDDTVLFLGTTTDSYTKGHIYQYQTDEWVDLSPEEGIDEEAREIATGAMALAAAASSIGELSDLDTTDKSSIVGAINEVATTTNSTVSSIGDLSELDTTNKSSVVSAINELVPDNDWETLTVTGQYIDNSIDFSAKYSPTRSLIKCSGFLNMKSTQFIQGMSINLVKLTRPTGSFPSDASGAVAVGADSEFPAFAGYYTYNNGSINININAYKTMTTNDGLWLYIGMMSV